MAKGTFSKLNGLFAKVLALVMVVASCDAGRFSIEEMIDLFPNESNVDEKSHKSCQEESKS